MTYVLQYLQGVMLFFIFALQEKLLQYITGNVVKYIASLVRLIFILLRIKKFCILCSMIHCLITEGNILNYFVKPLFLGTQLELASLPDRSMSPNLAVTEAAEKLRQAVQMSQVRTY